MRRMMAVAALAAGTVLLGGGAAAADPADAGNCVSTRDNGGAAGERISSFAGPGFGPFVADYLGGGTLGDEASDPACRRG